MKKHCLLLSLGLLILISCQDRFREENLPDPSVSLPEFEAVTDHFPADTRTSLLPDGQLIWNPDDKITVFPGSTLPVSYVVKAGTAGKTICTFIPLPPEKMTGNGSPLSRNVAVCPATAPLTGSLSETEAGHFTFRTVLPKVSRRNASGGFHGDELTMVAVSAGTHLAFRNCYGLVELQLKGTAVLRKIVLTGSNGEFLSGKHTLGFSEDQLPVCVPEGKFQTDWFSEKTLLLDDAVLQPDQVTRFYLAVPPVEFKNGFDLLLTDTRDRTYRFHAAAGNAVRRNDILVMPLLEIGAEEKIPQVKITHQLYFFTLPSVMGDVAAGTVNWGDQIEEAYRSAAQHTYTSGGEHEVTLAVPGAEGLSFDSLRGISVINLSQF